ncbi:GntR family transcriptional regulator [Variovorax saccharolyticus]|uniref:GntR family transcriptional regulator n=1 Tax=Variovorax saccharolyticus TaxID=3053516 RepID=UPI00257881CF|nr:GntR family transcriptional regulator [Variovorax sp. J22R187]MDM0018695.1 GntR family transcriptional regulator [Variovorax sp. J22R187]
MTTPTEISARIIESILARRLVPGARLGEQQLATVFGCSRTLVREALTALAVRGIVVVSARRGWFVVELSKEEAREAFEARLVIETGLLRRRRPDAAALRRLREHLARQRAALDASDPGARSFLLGDFHVCLAECLGNGILAESLRDLTARTTLVAMRLQSAHDAHRSCREHAAIVEALEAGDMPLAESRMAHHLETWETKLPMPVETDPVEQLRQALRPVDQMASNLHTSLPTQVRTSHSKRHVPFGATR